MYRQVQHLTDVLRSLEIEGLMWVEATKVSKQALSQTLNSLPAHLFALVFEQVIERLSAWIFYAVLNDLCADVA
ncbi:MAG: hypothetical protein V7K97_08680 [Nostoc sp.]|uniref:hypothetical protein n=1 Tax=Nostoc sp. TaxID=1180 RepID=UPI002FFB452C